MRSSVIRSLLVAILTALGLVATGTPSADAFVDPGVMLVKGPGSAYAPSLYASLSAPRGQTVKYGLKIVNTGANQAQYRVTLNWDPALYGGLYDGSTLLYKQKYWTPPIAPGKSKILTVKVAANTSAPQDLYAIDVDLYSAADDDYLESHLLLLNVAAPAKGTGAYDELIKNGAQKYIGGSVSGEVMSAPAVKPGGSASYTVRLQNDTTTANVIIVRATAPSCAGVSAKWTSGTADITDLVQSGSIGWQLNPGAHRDLKVTLRYGASATCTDALVTVSTSSDGTDTQVSNYLHLPMIS